MENEELINAIRRLNRILSGIGMILVAGIFYAAYLNDPRFRIEIIAGGFFLIYGLKRILL
jgi:hypothetical protein